MANKAQTKSGGEAPGFTQVKEFKPDDRFLPIHIYKFPLGNAGGITDQLGQEPIYIPCVTGNYRYDEIEQKDRIFVPEHRGRDYWALVPIVEPVGLIGPMAGGNLAYSSDSRCERVYHIHDRFETQEHYNANWN